MAIPTFNKFKSTTIYGNFVNRNYEDNSVVASATFSGNVSGITQPTIDNSTQFATTAFVKNQGYITSLSSINNNNDLNQYGGTKIRLYDSSDLSFTSISTLADGNLKIITDTGVSAVQIVASSIQLSVNLGSSYSNLVTASVLNTSLSIYQLISGMSAYLKNSVASSTYQLISGMSVYAPIASPTFTGIASCATAPTTVNHLCNKTYVDNVLVNGSLNNQYSKSKILI